MSTITIVDTENRPIDRRYPFKLKLCFLWQGCFHTKEPVRYRRISVSQRLKRPVTNHCRPRPGHVLPVYRRVQVRSPLQSVHNSRLRHEPKRTISSTQPASNYPGPRHRYNRQLRCGAGNRILRVAHYHIIPASISLLHIGYRQRCIGLPGQQIRSRLYHMIPLIAQ